MVTKTNSQTLESPGYGKTIVVEEVNKLILLIQNSEKDGIFIPGQLIDEIKTFADRNSLTYSIGGGKRVNVCCYNCLRAHVMKKAKEIKLGHERIAFLGEILKGGFGHNGYYLNKGKIIKI